MALDRSWFNALIDDDGSNTVGTVWNKAQIAALLDSVDAEFGKVTRAGIWYPTIGGSGGSTGVGHSYQNGMWHRVGDMVHAQGYSLLNTKGTISGSVVITGLPFSHSNDAGACYAVSTVWWNSLATNWTFMLARLGNGEINLALMGTTGPNTNSSINLTAADLTDSSQFMVDIVYRTDAL